VGSPDPVSNTAGLLRSRTGTDYLPADRHQNHNFGTPAIWRLTPVPEVSWRRTPSRSWKMAPVIS